jgi:hypothetical protein
VKYSEGNRKEEIERRVSIPLNHKSRIKKKKSLGKILWQVQIWREWIDLRSIQEILLTVGGDGVD